MPDTTIDPLDEAIKNINVKLDSRLKETDDKLSHFANTITEEIRAARVPHETPKNDKLWEKEDDDDEALVTKGALKATIREVVNEVTGSQARIAESVFDGRTTKLNRDVQVFNDFPQANKQSPHYNPKFMEQVTAEMNDRGRRGKDMNDPDLMYDSANAVWAQWVRKGLAAPTHQVHRKNEMDNARDDSFDLDGNPPIVSNKVTPKQIELARRAGLTKERFMELHERNSKFQ